MPPFTIRFVCTTNREHEVGIPPQEINVRDQDRALAEGRGMVYRGGLRCQQIAGRRFFLWPIRCDGKISPEIINEK